MEKQQSNEKVKDFEKAMEHLVATVINWTMIMQREKVGVLLWKGTKEEKQTVKDIEVVIRKGSKLVAEKGEKKMEEATKREEGGIKWVHNDVGEKDASYSLPWLI